MNWTSVEGKWHELKGQVRSHWGKLTNDDLETIAGKRDQLIGRIQQRYGLAQDAAEREVDNFIQKV